MTIDEKGNKHLPSLVAVNFCPHSRLEDMMQTTFTLVVNSAVVRLLIFYTKELSGKMILETSNPFSNSKSKYPYIFSVSGKQTSSNSPGSSPRGIEITYSLIIYLSIKIVKCTSLCGL